MGRGEDQFITAMRERPAAADLGLVEGLPVAAAKGFRIRTGKAGNKDLAQWLKRHARWLPDTDDWLITPSDLLAFVRKLDAVIAAETKRSRELSLANVSPTLARREQVNVKEQGGKFLARKDGGDTVFLLRYLKTGSITHELYRAGNTLFQDWSRSGLDPLASAPDMQVYTGAQKMPGFGPRAVEYHRAMSALGPYLGSAARWVCIENDRIERWALSRGLKREDGMGILRVALMQLRDHYDRQPADEAAGLLSGMG